MIGMELDHPGTEVFKRCLEKGLLINCTHQTVLRLMPAMTISKQEIDEGLTILREALREEGQ